MASLPSLSSSSSYASAPPLGSSKRSYSGVSIIYDSENRRLCFLIPTLSKHLCPLPPPRTLQQRRINPLSCFILSKSAAQLPIDISFTSPRFLRSLVCPLFPSLHTVPFSHPPSLISLFLFNMPQETRTVSGRHVNAF